MRKLALFCVLSTTKVLNREARFQDTVAHGNARRGGSCGKPDRPPPSSAAGMLLLRRPGPLDLPQEHLLRHQPLRRVGIAAAGVDGVEADVQNVPAAETSTLFRKRAQIEPPLSPAFRWGGCGRVEKGNPYQ